MFGIYSNWKSVLLQFIFIRVKFVYRFFSQLIGKRSTHYSLVILKPAYSNFYCTNTYKYESNIYNKIRMMNHKKILVHDMEYLKKKKKAIHSYIQAKMLESKIKESRSK